MQRLLCYGQESDPTMQSCMLLCGKKNSWLVNTGEFTGDSFFFRRKLCTQSNTSYH
jgi:hypothetical protein